MFSEEVFYEAAQVAASYRTTLYLGKYDGESRPCIMPHDLAFNTIRFTPYYIVHTNGHAYSLYDGDKPWSC